MNKHFLALAPEVQWAVEEGKPIVALESTVISHGLPYPDNLDVTNKMLAAIKAKGAIPAVIGLINGNIKIGLSAEEIELFATAKEVLKISRADISACVAQRHLGATTVAGTMFCAALAGIRVFATGGIGGVHRGAETSFDISADLTEFAKTPVLVVCSGAKSILDVPKTLEFLETQGVPIIGYQTDYLPLFYIEKSKYHLNLSVDSAENTAQIAKVHWSLGLNGILIVNPIPTQDSLIAKDINGFIQQATNECLEKNICGKEVTPYILARLSELSHGKTLQANKVLLINNAATAGEIAVALGTSHNAP
ncbi:MAG: pseudouridine-5'-phosphate glycosidase [Gammaproteobacteria bacterium]